MSKTLYESNTLDYETGEIKSSTWIRGKKLSQESFVRTYIGDIGILAKCSGSEVSTEAFPPCACVRNIDGKAGLCGLFHTLNLK